MTPAHSDDARVAEFELAPDTVGEAHYHPAVAEYCICLQGQIQVTVGGGSSHSLQPGGRLTIPAGVRQVSNIGSAPCITY